ncbi:hypothetical protein M885DRAFT_508560 [Pelagophyceae sp. CCMP2097]|nr:hypothetical protein M885DRAFT_508560 [Pelagophyceae sp. CCMP2097]
MKAVLLLLWAQAHGLVLQRAGRPVRAASVSDGDFEAPSDTGDWDGKMPETLRANYDSVGEVPSDVSDDDAKGSGDGEAQLLAAAAPTARGATAGAGERLRIDGLCRDLEAAGFSPAQPLDGVWRLEYSSEPGIYRQSPFFWGFSQLLGSKTSPVQLDGAETNDLAANVYALTDALPFYTVGRATQTIFDSGTSRGKLVSQVELNISPFGASLPKATSVMTSTARTAPRAAGLELTLETTEVKDSTLQRLPGLGFIGDLAFPTESAFDKLAGALGGALGLQPQAAIIACDITYVSKALRITRTPGGYLFVHVREA